MQIDGMRGFFLLIVFSVSVIIIFTSFGILRNSTHLRLWIVNDESLRSKRDIENSVNVTSNMMGEIYRTKRNIENTTKKSTKLSVHRKQVPDEGRQFLRMDDTSSHLKSKLKNSSKVSSKMIVKKPQYIDKGRVLHFKRDIQNSKTNSTKTGAQGKQRYGKMLPFLVIGSSPKTNETLGVIKRNNSFEKYPNTKGGTSITRHLSQLDEYTKNSLTNNVSKTNNSFKLNFDANNSDSVSSNISESMVDIKTGFQIKQTPGKSKTNIPFVKQPNTNIRRLSQIMEDAENSSKRKDNLNATRMHNSLENNLNTSRYNSIAKDLSQSVEDIEIRFRSKDARTTNRKNNLYKKHFDTKNGDWVSSNLSGSVLGTETGIKSKNNLAKTRQNSSYRNHFIQKHIDSLDI